MIPRIKTYEALDNFLLSVEFDDGYKVLYDVKEDIEAIPSFCDLMNFDGLFHQVQLDSSRTCLYWNEKIDLPSDAIYEHGKANLSSPKPYPDIQETVIRVAEEAIPTPHVAEEE